MNKPINNKVARILELFEPVDSARVKKELTARIKQLGMEPQQLHVEDVMVDTDGNIIVDFADVEHTLPIVFHVDAEDGPTAIALVEPEDDEEDEETDFLAIDLSHNAVPLIITKFGTYINMLNLEWFDKKLVDAIRSILDDDVVTEESISEVSKIVIRGGKKVKIQLVRRKRKKRLSAAARQGILKSKVKRKAKQAQTSRKLKKSAKLRKRSNLKRGNPAGLKVQGTK